MGAKRLLMDGLQRTTAFGVAFVAKQCLRTGRNICQRIVDLVTGAVSKLFQGIELGALKTLLKLAVRIRHLNVGNADRVDHLVAGCSTSSSWQTCATSCSTSNGFFM